MKAYARDEMWEMLIKNGSISTSQVNDRKKLVGLIWYLRKVKGFNIERERLHPDGSRNQEHIYHIVK